MDLRKISKYIPSPIFDICLSIYNNNQYKVRYGDVYKKCLVECEYHFNLEKEVLLGIQNKKFVDFINKAKKDSPYYCELLSDIEIKSLSDLDKIPFLTKKILVDNLNDIATINEKDAVISLTGGTTGASMKVLYTKDDVQKRNAILDSFRHKYGYKLGKKTLWFSGKLFISDRDVKNKKYHKDDYINNIRYFSTFHLNKETALSYIKAIIDYKPEYIIGFPSSVYLLCKYAKELGYNNISNVNCFFPTAETVTFEHRCVISEMFDCNIKNQYASSEGAPFIIECDCDNLHMNITSGIFEVLDENDLPTKHGALVVTAFNTNGTPLIRYKIGDRVKIKEGNIDCSCGLKWPIVDYIDGRVDDFLFSIDNEKINLGNISNSTKGVNGLVCFQIEQNIPNELLIKIVTNCYFEDKDRVKFIKNLKERFGNKMEMIIQDVDNISVEKSGKFRIIKNNIKDDFNV